MTQDNGMDNDTRLPITKEGLLAALDEALKLIEKEQYQVAREYLRGLYRNIRDERLVPEREA